MDCKTRPTFVLLNIHQHNMIQTDILLETFQQHTEQLLHKAISDWQLLSPEQLSYTPAPGAWSAAQCLEHLNIYGQYYLPALEKAIDQGKKQGSLPKPVFRAGWLGAYFTKLMQPQPDGTLKSKMAAPKNAVPAAAPEPLAMLAEFIDQQEKMLDLLRRAADVDLNGNRVPISLTPWIRLKLGDTFGFVIAHIERHVRQAERALTNYTSPAAGIARPVVGQS